MQVGRLLGYLLFFLSSVTALAQIKVAVLDTGLDLTDSRFKSVLCESGHKDFTGEGLEDKDGHGTHVAGLIKEYAGDTGYCLIILKYYKETSPYDNTARIVEALRYIKGLNVDIVNFSGGGIDRSDEEFNAIAALPKVAFIVAAGNLGKPFTKVPFFPACYGLPNITVVTSTEDNGELSSFSGWGYGVKREKGCYFSTFPKGFQAYLCGTSMATAVYTGKYIRKLLK